MRRSFSPAVRARAALCITGACFLVAGCGGDPCDAGIQANGGKYDVYVTALDTPVPGPHGTISYPASTGSCAGFDGIAPGSTLSFQTIGAIDDDAAQCRYARAELLTGPAPLTPRSTLSDPLAGKPVIAADPIMEAFANVTTASCTGALVFVFLEYDLYRLFLPSSPPSTSPSGGSCAICDDTFAIEMIPL